VVARSASTTRGSAVSVAAVGWSDDAFARAWMVREEVFCDELGRPYEVEGDDDDRGAVHLVALDADGRAVGCARLVRRGDVAELGRVAVRANRRRQGFGAALVRAAVARAENLPLAVNARPETAAFFEAQGFVAVGETSGPEGSPAIRMQRAR